MNNTLFFFGFYRATLRAKYEFQYIETGTINIHFLESKKSMPPLDSLIDIHCAYNFPIFSLKKAKQNKTSNL